MDGHNPTANSHQLASADGLRIALFTGNYNYLREGANNALNRLVGHVLDRGGKVRIYSPTSRTPAFVPVGHLVSVPSVALPVRSEFRVALGLPRVIRRDVEAYGPNIVHVATPDLLGTAALRFARRRAIPAIASLHTLFETYLDYYGLGAFRRWAWNRQRSYYRQAAFVLAPSPAMVGHLQAMGVPGNRIHSHDHLAAVIHENDVAAEGQNLDAVATRIEHALQKCCRFKALREG